MNKFQNLIKGVIGSILVMTVGCNGNTSINYENGAVPPEEAAETYHVTDGFQVQLFASEPIIENPTDMTVDEDGSVYVTEMKGYPLKMNHTGTIKLLRDTDGDGLMDASVLFADHLMFPSGVMPWKGGVMVTDTPYVVYFKDTSGDGRADVRDTVLTGFALSNPQVNVNNPVYGLDNWIYLANFGPVGAKNYPNKFGDKGRKVTFWKDPEGPELPKDGDSKNVRFKPGEKKLELLSSNDQFGQTFNTWGDHFLNWNRNHIYEGVLGKHYLDRNPKAPISDVTANISDHGNQAQLYQIRKDPEGRLVTRPQLTTSASGITYYSGGLFPPPYNTNVTFGAESAFNVVHADKLTPKGATFVASRIKANQEFLASTDDWARPENMYIGPDGALFVVDFYQKIIEHPEWMSKEGREGGGLYKGQKMGRIYRITPEGTPNASWTTGLGLGKAPSMELVEHLSDANSWWRRNAQRLLVARNDQDVAPLLEEKAVEDTSAFGRLHALWTLEGLDVLPVGIIEKALQDKVGGVRRNALRLAENFIDQSDALRQQLYAMGDDNDAKVRFQLLNTLGYLKNEQAWQVRKDLLVRDIDDQWVRRSALTAANVQPNRLLKAVMGRYEKKNTPAYLAMTRQLTNLVGAAGQQKEIGKLIQSATVTARSPDHQLQSAILAGLTEGLARNNNREALLAPAEDRLITTFFTHSSESVKEYSLQLLQTEDRAKRNDQAMQKAAHKAMKMAQNQTLSGSERGQMLKFLTLTDPSSYSGQIKALIERAGAPEVQKAAITVLGQIPGPGPARYLVENWKLIKSTVKNTALDTFLSDKDRAALLLNALKEGDIPIGDMGGAFRARLMRYGNQKMQKRAKNLLATDTGEEIPPRYKKALTLKGNIRNGSNVFEQHCSTCHQLKEAMGVAYGPDLGTVRAWANRDLMANILHPNLSIAQGFDLWTIQLKNGGKVQGIIRNKTSNTIVLETGPGAEKTINRQEVAGMNSLGDVSAMPPGFASRLTPQKMADLMAFIKKSIE